MNKFSAFEWIAFAVVIITCGIILTVPFNQKRKTDDHCFWTTNAAQGVASFSDGKTGNVVLGFRNDGVVVWRLEK